jgi:hypothetical protein
MELEKRSQKRQVLDVDVKIDGVGGKSRNLSMGGMCAIITKEIPVLQDIRITLYLPKNNLNIIGTALRCTPVTSDFYEAGIYFQTANISKDDRKILADFLGITLSDKN